MVALTLTIASFSDTASGSDNGHSRCLRVSLRWLFIALLCFQTVCIHSSSSLESTICDLYLAYKPPFGLGVIAGEPWNPGDIVDASLGIAIPTLAHFNASKSKPPLLANYIESFNETHDLITLGFAGLFNHAPLSYNNRDPERSPSRQRTSSMVKRVGQVNHGQLMVFTIATVPIQSGQEILMTYGSPEWFTSRGLVEFNPVSVGDTVDRLSQPTLDRIVPGCSTLLTVIADENRLLAASHIAQGTVIEVTRAIPIDPEYAMLSQLSSNLLRYLWWIDQLPESDECQSSPQNCAHIDKSIDSRRKLPLLVLGNGALYAKVHKTSTVAVNVEVTRWWPTGTSASASSNQIASTRISEDSDLFVKFIATKDIVEGEVLMFDIAQMVVGIHAPWIKDEL